MGVGSFDRVSQTVLWIEKFKIQNSNLIVITKAIIMMVVCTGTMKINFFAKDLQALAGGTGII